ncbi:MAG: RNA polymerase sigma factor [Duncaniella sp.]|nr:RNA polymerase sigma factor [Duncaniella sp.]MDE7145688.1 RNA polymerase sigma factor [Duncaniella sp.]
MRLIECMENLDANIIRRVLDGDSDSYRNLMDRYSQQVFALIVRIIDNPDDAEEATQDVFFKAFRNLERFDGRSAFSTWLYRIAYNEAVSRSRSCRNREETLDEAQLRCVSDAQVDSVLESDDPRLAALPDAVDRLTVDERALVTLHYYEEIPLKEVASMIGITESAAKVRLMRTRKKLYVLINKLTRNYE